MSTSAAIRESRATVKKDEKPKVLDFTDIQKMIATEPEDKIVEAKERIDQAMLSLNLKWSRLCEQITSKCYYLFPTKQIDTMAVAASGNGYAMMMWDPDFVCALSSPVDDTAFGVMHESLHLFFGHLSTDRELMKNPTYTIAQEIIINDTCLKRLNRKALPSMEKTDPLTGKVTKESVGIDPQKMYRDYAKVVDNPVTFDMFVSTELACFSELMRMPNPPGEQKKYQVCVHQAGSGVGDDKGDGQGLPSDDETIGNIVKGALDSMMQDALKGDSLAREEILDLAGKTEGNSDAAAKMWGDLGLGSLRGETVKTRKIEWWSRWLRRVLGSKLTHGGKLIYPRKRAGILSLLGYDSPMLHRGPEKTKKVVRAIDTSGSMSQEFLNRFFKVCGGTTGVEWIDLSFDAVVMPYQAGERVYGGGGTSFKVVQDYVEGNLEVNGKKFDGRYDAILMVTDGYAPQIHPKEPSKWIWLITEDGDMWMDGQMLCHRIDLPNG